MALKKSTYTILILLALCNSSNSQELKLMSYNIRLIADDKENSWPNRREEMAALLNYYEADFIGLQEVVEAQRTYLLEHMPAYQSIGVARDDGKAQGEYSCIFYKQQSYRLLQQGTFWLSPTPNQVSFGWNAACRRVCTYGLFERITDHYQCWVMNTHFDHLGDTARLESARLIIQKAGELRRKHHAPLFLTGDFNSRPGEAPEQLLNTTFTNTRKVSQTTPVGTPDTWNEFRHDLKPNGTIDFIFALSEDHPVVAKFITITHSFDQRYPSDHFPILTHIQTKTNNHAGN